MGEKDIAIVNAADSDFRRACKIFGYTPEEVEGNQDLFAEIAEFLMMTEVSP